MEQMTDREFAEHVRRECVRLAGIFGNIASQAGEGSHIFMSARRGGLAALELCTLAANRNIDRALVDDVAALEASGYDLAALATTPPATLED